MPKKIKNILANLLEVDLFKYYHKSSSSSSIVIIINYTKTLSSIKNVCYHDYKKGRKKETELNLTFQTQNKLMRKIKRESKLPDQGAQEPFSCFRHLPLSRRDRIAPRTSIQKSTRKISRRKNINRPKQVKDKRRKRNRQRKDEPVPIRSFSPCLTL